LSKTNTVILKLTHAIVIAGQVIGTGRLIEVTRQEAKDLLHRGKAVLHDEDVGDDEVTSSGTIERELHPEIAAHQEDSDQGEQDGQHAASDGADTEPTGNASRARGGRTSKQK